MHSRLSNIMYFIEYLAAVEQVRKEFGLNKKALMTITMMPINFTFLAVSLF
jgi:hypothetical protein